MHLPLKKILDPPLLGTLRGSQVLSILEAVKRQHLKLVCCGRSPFVVVYFFSLQQTYRAVNAMAVNVCRKRVHSKLKQVFTEEIFFVTHI